MTDFNRGEIPEAVAAFFGIKGVFRTAINDSIQPVVTVGSILESPYLKYGNPVALGGGLSAAGAGRQGHIVLSPGLQIALEIHQLLVSNTTAGIWTISVRMATATQIATLANLTAGVQAKDLANQTAGTTRSSSHRTGDLNSSVGTALFSVAIAANSDRVIELPDPVVLYGNDPGGRPGLIIANTTANADVNGFAFGKEWPLPG